MAMLDRKLWRDLVRMRIQVLAIALVMACGVATIVLAVGAYRSLEETRTSFYDRYRFGNVFSSAVRAPLELRSRLASISGISGLELRIRRPVLLDLEGMIEPATGYAVSIPDHGEPAVNALHLRSGRLPEPGRTGEVAVLESFAKAHRLQPGSRFRALMDGTLRTLSVTAIVLSPEYVYAISPGDMVPDPRRFGVFFMPRAELEGMFDMEGAFNDLAATTLRDAPIDPILDEIDAILRPYGGAGAHDREDQLSHTFLDNELTQLSAMAAVIPPVFLLVAAFLVNMILRRMIALEREQIGLFKAIGYGDLLISWHYAKFTVAIALVGIAVGAGTGAWLGRGLTRLYGEFFSFPFLIFHQSTDLYAIAAAVTVASALAGSARAIWNVVSLPAAVAMQPPAPTRYRHLLSGTKRIRLPASQLSVMAVRHIVRWPLRAALTVLGVSLPVALLVTALFSNDSIEAMVDIVFIRSERQDATLVFSNERAPAALQAVATMPGVLVAEPFRSVAAILRNGHRERRLAISGIADGADLTRVLDTGSRAVEPPGTGLMLSRRVADLLHLEVGDLADVILLERDRRVVRLPVTSLVESLVGLAAYARNDVLDRLVGDGTRLSGVRIAVDGARLSELYAAVKRTPAIGSIALQGVSRMRFRETIEENIGIMMTVYVGMALIITFGIIYNSARIQLSERARELASLRVLGFSRAEVSSVLLLELGGVVLLAQPVGWLLGHLFSLAVVKGFESDLFRIPFVIDSSTYATSSLIVIAAAAVSALIVRRRIDRLDLVEVLKARE